MRFSAANGERCAAHHLPCHKRAKRTPLSAHQIATNATAIIRARVCNFCIAVRALNFRFRCHFNSQVQLCWQRSGVECALLVASVKLFSAPIYPNRHTQRFTVAIVPRTYLAGFSNSLAPRVALLFSAASRCIARRCVFCGRSRGFDNLL